MPKIESIMEMSNFERFVYFVEESDHANDPNRFLQLQSIASNYAIAAANEAPYVNNHIKFGHSYKSTEDFCKEIDAIQKMLEDRTQHKGMEDMTGRPLGIIHLNNNAVQNRISKALGFIVVDYASYRAKQVLLAFEESIKHRKEIEKHIKSQPHRESQTQS